MGMVLNYCGETLADCFDYIPDTYDCQKEDKGLCPILEIYGSYSGEAEILRSFREKVLSQTPQGQELIRLYYEWSLAIVKVKEADEEFKEEVKEMIDGVLEMMERGAE